MYIALCTNRTKLLADCWTIVMVLSVILNEDGRNKIIWFDKVCAIIVTSNYYDKKSSLPPLWKIHGLIKFMTLKSCGKY